MRPCYKLAATFAPLAAVALEDGLAREPPMGFSTWLAYYGEVNQTILERAMDAMVRAGPGGGKSLLELGYSNVGLDDGWQACGTGLHGSFHNAAGQPLPNSTRFPDLRAMTDRAHSLRLSSSWYGNNCLCKEDGVFTGDEIDEVYQGDTDAIVGYGFDGIKFDGCGQFMDLDRQSQQLNASGHPTVIENCHWGNDGPHVNAQGDFVCPFHYFRSSGDMAPHFDGIMTNLQSVYRWNMPSHALSRPGCWAYPDMMAVGLVPYSESRTNFAAWCVTSSPLVLAFDITDADELARMWPIIANEEMIAVNQEWAGHPGTLVKSVLPPGAGGYLWAETCDPDDPAQQGWQKKPLSDDKFLITWQDKLCVSAFHRPIKMAFCNASDPLQAWGTNEYGVLSHDRADGSAGGIDLFGKRGPVTSLDKSYGPDALNEQFEFVDGWLRDKGVDDADGLYPTRCLAARDASPEYKYIEEIRWQIWAKPLLRGRVAVVVLNQQEQDLQATIQFSDVGLSGDVDVRDLFEQKDLGTFSTRFVTDEVPIRDSRMLLLTPAVSHTAIHV